MKNAFCDDCWRSSVYNASFGAGSGIGEGAVGHGSKKD